MLFYETIRKAKTIAELHEIFEKITERARQYPEYEFVNGYFFDGTTRKRVVEYLADHSASDIIQKYAEVQSEIMSLFSFGNDITAQEFKDIQLRLPKLDEYCDEFERYKVARDNLKDIN